MSSTVPSSVDWEADVYARGKQLNRWPYSEVVSAVLRASAGRDRREVAVLEIGCGAGNNVWFLAAEGLRAHGIDMSPTAIAHARKRLLAEGLEADLRVGDIAALPWPDACFDIVIDRGALTQNTHERIDSILGEVSRVLKPGGIMFCFTLFGMGHADRVHGVEVAHHSYDNFRAGYFQAVGLTSFFTRNDLVALFGRFREARIERVAVYDDEERMQREEFIVRAVR